ncbi:coiled-coil domain-containing protein 84 [Protobothrops mucrosquamatus]|uniref:coiled-coil domain-containing protein 84 n=1 Tax=Protobothrops mucrosquamatus TaxID=103944 RepID=UPI0010FB5EEF|nr:coiled-coil domain-containing protein 84 [Protobothrops mucrosquamatus]
MAAVRAATVFRCQLCRRSAFAGRRSHLYSAGHQRRLRAALARLGEKVAAARAAARRAEVLPFQAGEHERRAWCPCCAREVRRHLSRGARTVLHGGLLQHLASPEHGRAVAAFWRKNRADPKLKANFLLSAAEYRRFQESLCKALDAYEEKEDVAIQEAAAHIRNMEQKRREMVQAILEPQRADTRGDGSTAVNTFTGNLSDSPFAMEEQEQPGSSWNTFLREDPSCASRTVPELQYTETGQPLTFIGHQETGREGNVHTGAKPPWLMNEEKEGERQIGPSYEEFLKEKQKQKLKQLPPNRVGANFDHSCQTGDGWLPSFGRVWNHGRRWQSSGPWKCIINKIYGQKSLCMGPGTSHCRRE